MGLLCECIKTINELEERYGVTIEEIGFELFQKLIHHEHQTLLCEIERELDFKPIKRKLN